MSKQRENELKLRVMPWTAGNQPRNNEPWTNRIAVKHDMRNPATMAQLLEVKALPENHRPLGDYCPAECEHRGKRKRAS